MVYKKGQLRPRDIDQLIKYQESKDEKAVDENANAGAETLQIVEQSQFVPTLTSLQKNIQSFNSRLLAMQTLAIC